jgi:hypothetical protein
LWPLRLFLDLLNRSTTPPSLVSSNLPIPGAQLNPQLKENTRNFKHHGQPYQTSASSSASTPAVSRPPKVSGKR